MADILRAGLLHVYRDLSFELVAVGPDTTKPFWLSVHDQHTAEELEQMFREAADWISKNKHGEIGVN